MTTTKILRHVFPWCGTSMVCLWQSHSLLLKRFHWRHYSDLLAYRSLQNPRPSFVFQRKWENIDTLRESHGRYVFRWHSVISQQLLVQTKNFKKSLAKASWQESFQVCLYFVDLGDKKKAVTGCHALCFCSRWPLRMVANYICHKKGIHGIIRNEKSVLLGFWSS